MPRHQRWQQQQSRVTPLRVAAGCHGGLGGIWAVSPCDSRSLPARGCRSCSWALLTAHGQSWGCHKAVLWIMPPRAAAIWAAITTRPGRPSARRSAKEISHQLWWASSSHRNIKAVRGDLSHLKLEVWQQLLKDRCFKQLCGTQMFSRRRKRKKQSNDLAFFLSPA